MKTDSELVDILDKPDIDPEYKIAIEFEIEKRKTANSFNQPLIYPEKPEKTEKRDIQNSLKNSIYSLIIYGIVFHYILKFELSYIIILVGVMLIHELGHYIAMNHFKYKDLNMFFIPLVGAFVSGKKNQISQKQSFIISIAGPLPGIIIGTIFYVYGIKYSNESLILTADIFIYLNLFNLIPIMPLDGGQILKTVFFESKEKVNKIFTWISIGLFLILALSLESFILLIIPFFLYLQYTKQEKTRKMRLLLESKGIQLEKKYENLTNEEYWVLRKEIIQNERGFSLNIDSDRLVHTPYENKIVNYIENLIQLPPKQDITTLGRIGVILTFILAYVIPHLIIAIFYIKYGMLH